MKLVALPRQAGPDRWMLESEFSDFIEFSKVSMHIDDMETSLNLATFLQSLVLIGLIFR